MQYATAKIRANLKVSAKKISQCEARAHQIVELFIDPVTDEDYFLSQLRWINQDHYQSITEERAIQKTCGYPLCENKLIKIPMKRYQICTTVNKVYDISDRKNFCSNECYKASCYLKQQLFVSPLWVREKEEETKFLLLTNSTGLKGEEISFGIEKVSSSSSGRAPDETVNEESKVLESERHCISVEADISANYFSADENNESNHPITFDHSLRHEANKNLPSCSVGAKISSPLHRNSLIDSNVHQMGNIVSEKCVERNLAEPKRDLQFDENRMSNQVSVTSISSSSSAFISNEEIPKQSFLDLCDRPHRSAKVSKYRITLPETSPSQPKKTIGSSNNFVLRVEQSLREWFTVDTVCFVMGGEKVRQAMLEKGDVSATKNRVKCDPRLYERYASICKKLKILELEEVKGENEAKTYEKPTKPLPDYAVLKQQTKQMEIKARAFYRGDKKVTFVQNQKDSDEKKEDETAIVLPPLHQYAKIAIRRNIVLDKLKNVLPDFAAILGLQIIDLSEKVKELALTCKFEAHNVTFKPLEWNLIGFILIKLLSLRDTAIQKCLHDKANYVNAVLMSYQLESNYLDLLCIWLMDLDQILENEDNPS